MASTLTVDVDLAVQTLADALCDLNVHLPQGEARDLATNALYAIQRKGNGAAADLRSALEEARALLETAEQDGYVGEGWREDARSWASCWKDVLTA